MDAPSENPGAESTAHGALEWDRRAGNSNPENKLIKCAAQAPENLFGELERARADHRTEAALAKYGATDSDAVLICGLARVSPAINLYEPADNGRDAIIVPVYDNWDLCDLIAFDPRAPEVWWCRIGGEPLLGCNWLANADHETPVRVFATPLDWLRAGCEGVVILDNSRSFGALNLYGLPEVWILPELVTP